MKVAKHFASDNFPLHFETDTLAVHANGHSFRLPLYIREVGRRECLLGHTPLGYLQPFPDGWRCWPGDRGRPLDEACLRLLEGACRLLGVGK